MVFNLLTHRRLVTVLLLLTVSASHALTLGRTRGAVLIGQPLNIEVQLTLANGETASDFCFEADVFHADTLVPPSKVSVTTATAGAGQALLRIRSQAVVDEPFVMLFVRAGCAEKVTRRYVLLADVASELSAPPITVSPATLPAAASTGRLPSPDSPQGKTVASAEASVPAQIGVVNQTTAKPVAKARPGSAKSASTLALGTETATPSAQKALAAAQSGSRSGSAKAKNIVKPQTARLVIDPLEQVAERAPVLKLSTEMLSTPAENNQQRAALAGLWRALSAQPLDLLRDIERLDRLEAQANTTRIQNTQQQERINALSLQVQTLQAERYSNPLIYALCGVLALALASAAYFWRRSRHGGISGRAWWLAQKNESVMSEQWPPSRPVGLVREAQARAEAKGLQHKAVNVPEAVSPSNNLDFDLSKAARRTSARSDPPMSRHFATAPSLDATDSGHSQLGRAVNAEELIDVQQQADFFVSLEQYDQAISVLKDHIKDSVQTSALAYLDLLQIYHSLDRKVDYSLLRDEFQKVFNAHAPAFADFGVRTRGLESYAIAMARIQALWPSSKVLDVIEESIFRKPGEADGEAFDLEAYRDMVLLHTLVKTLMEFDKLDSVRPSVRTVAPAATAKASRKTQRDGKANPVGYPSTDVQPLSATVEQASSQRSGTELEITQDLYKPPASMRLGLDFDLSKLDAIKPSTAPAIAPNLTPSSSASDMALPDLQLALEPIEKTTEQAVLPNRPNA